MRGGTFFEVSMTVEGYQSKVRTSFLHASRAPQGIARNGKFYLYVPLNNNTGAKIGVCVADNPIGPFKDAIGKELAQSGSMAIDPTVDDDGQAYLYWGNGNLRFVKLNSDMISTSGSVTSNVAMSGFTEGPWFYKRGSLVSWGFRSLVLHGGGLGC